MNFSSGSTIKTKQVFKKTNPYVAASLWQWIAKKRFSKKPMRRDKFPTNKKQREASQQPGTQPHQILKYTYNCPPRISTENRDTSFKKKTKTSSDKACGSVDSLEPSLKENDSGWLSVRET
jgi:hypothetical protein